MLSGIKLRHFIGLALIFYRVGITKYKAIGAQWYDQLAESFWIEDLPETYAGPFPWVVMVIIHRVIIHTALIFCWTGSKGFTHLYGIIELMLFVTMIVLYIARSIFGSWVLISFEIFDTFLHLLTSPTLLIVFLPAYYLFHHKSDTSSMK